VPEDVIIVTTVHDGLPAERRAEMPIFDSCTAASILDRQWSAIYNGSDGLG
jgi:hypothetical protein